MLFDPYDASFEWNILEPYLNGWGEVLINHMSYDSARGIVVAKNEETIKKYEMTYQNKLDELIEMSSDKEKYCEIIIEIIKKLANENKMNYISAFPVYNSKNGLMYNLIHWTTNIEGKKLFKNVVWKTFEGKSSNKHSENSEKLRFSLAEDEIVTTITDENCYNIIDIAKYLQHKYKNKNVLLENIWADLDVHPIFPSAGFKPQIKKMLKELYLAKIGKNDITFQ